MGDLNVCRLALHSHKLLKGNHSARAVASRKENSVKPGGRVVPSSASISKHRQYPFLGLLHLKYFCKLKTPVLKNKTTNPEKPEI